MGLSSILYLFKEGLKNIWRNLMMSVASVGILILCLMLTGAAVLASMNISSALKAIESQNTFNVYLKDNVQTLEAVQIGEKIKALDNVAECEFYSKDEAIQKFSQDLGPLFENLQGDKNPLPHSFHIKLKDLSQYKETKAAIDQIEGIDGVSDRSTVAERLTKLDNGVHIIGSLVVIILIVVSLFIVTNTIKITMFSRRFEISIMKSVGATDIFVRIPFIVEGVVLGIISAIIASFMLILTYDSIIGYVKQLVPFAHIPFNSVSSQVFLSFICAGILFGLVGGFISIGKYLKKEGGEILGW